jgi:dTMP kinase
MPSEEGRRGLFLTLEGGEGSGKSAQARALKGLLESKGHVVTLTREPAGGSLGQRVAQLLSQDDPTLDPRSELFLFAAARAQHLADVIRPALQRGEGVICDRFADSTLAYQGYGRALSLDEVRTVNRIATGGLTPDLTVLLDVPVDVGLARKRSEPGADRIGRESAEFHERVRQGYLAIAAAEPQRFLVLDATRPPEPTTQAIWRRLQPLLSGIRG